MGVVVFFGHHTACIINYILLINFSLVVFLAVYYAKHSLSADSKSNDTNNSYFPSSNSWHAEIHNI